MSEATNVRIIDGALRLTDDDGNTLATFAGNDLPAWRQFQLNAVKDFNIIVTDRSMPVQISKTIAAPNKRDDKFVASG